MVGTFKDVIDSIYNIYKQEHGTGIHVVLYMDKKFYEIPNANVKAFRKYLRDVEVFICYGDIKEVCIVKTNLLKWDTVDSMMWYFDEEYGIDCSIIFQLAN